MKTKLRTEQEFRNELARFRKLLRQIEVLEAHGGSVRRTASLVYERILTLEWALGKRN